MDPLSITASVIAVIQISNAVLLSCYRLQSQIKDADTEIAQVVGEVEDLASILNDLQDILQQPDSDLSDLSSPLLSCLVVLEELQQKLAPLAKPGLKHKLFWPFESKGIQRKLEIIQKQKLTLQLALSGYQTRLLVRQATSITGIQSSASQIEVTVQEVKDSVSKLTSQWKQQAILDWYKTSAPEQNHGASRDQHEPDTGNWVFESKEFQSWSMHRNESIWIHGIPGAGKTVLCSTIINHLEESYYQDDDFTVVYYYFDFRDGTKQTVSNLLKSIIFQLASRSTGLTESAIALYEKHRGSQEPSPEELFHVFRDDIQSAGRTFLIIDALDECPQQERKVFLKLFFERTANLDINILITSRKEADLENRLKDAVSHVVCIQSAQVDADIRLYVRNIMARDPELSGWKPSIQQEIESGIVEGSNGMFRWATCQLEVMKSCLTPAMVRAELKRMPDTLDHMYDRILQAIPKLHQQYAKAALCWIAFSARPLTLSELGEAVIIDAEEESFDPENSRLRDHTLILNLCGGLVTASDWLRTPNTRDWADEKILMQAPPFNPSTQFKVVSLSHYSVKEYIISRRLCDSNLSQFFISEHLAHQLLAKACLVHLLEFNKGGIASTIDFVEFPLLHYCAYNWMRHWRGGTADAALQRLLSRLFDPTELSSFVNWLNISNPDIAPSSWSSGFGTTFTHPQERKRTHELYPQPLYFAALLGDIQLVHFAIEDGCDVSAKEGNLGSALAVAAFHCHEPIVEFLLENGADPNGGGGRYGSVLQAAAVGGSECIVRLLLDAGADLNIQSGEYNTALVAAASTEHDKVVSLLVSRGADLRIGSTAHGSSLYQAAATGDTTMVLALLGAGADINEIAEEKGTALCAAAHSGSMALVQLLLRRGADVNRGGDGRSSYPLIEAARKGHSPIVRVLIRAGANVNISGGPYRLAALEAAVQSRETATFRALLDADADIYFKGSIYKDCLHAAIYTGELGMAKIVLDMVTHVDDLVFLEAVGRYNQDSYFFRKMMELGANVDAHARSEGSALHIAVKRRCKEAVWLLLNNNAYINAVAETGSVLQAAIDTEMDDVAEELVRRGADVNISGTGGTPFQAACWRGNLVMATHLLENGADVNASSSDCPSALVSACEKEDQFIVEFLLEKGTDVNILGGGCDNCTPLQMAAKKGNLRLLDLLIDNGARINGQQGSDGSTIEFAIRSGDESVVRYLLDKGVSVVEPDRAGSPVCMAIFYSMKNIIPLLLQKGADMNKPGGSPATPPTVAAWQRGEEETMQFLIDHGASLDHEEAFESILANVISTRKPLDVVRRLLDLGADPNAGARYGHDIPLVVAARQGNEAAVRLLLEYGGDLNIKLNSSISPLTGACISGDLSMVRFLLSHGADVNAVPHNRSTVFPLYAAARHSHPQIINILLKHGADVRVQDGQVFEAAFEGGPQILSRLLQLSLLPSEKEIYLDKALQKSASHSNLTLCTWLLDHGANVNFSGGEFGSPLQAVVSYRTAGDAATQNNRNLIFAMFLERGAKVNLSDPKRAWPSPLMAAMKSYYQKATSMLLAAGADVNCYGGKLHCPLQCAARHSTAALRLILATGVDVNVVGGKYGTALHAAAYAHDLERLQLLLERGADATIIAGKYGSCIQAAAKTRSRGSGDFLAERQSVEAMELLLEHGASVTAVGGNCGSALHHAAKTGNLEAVKWLITHGADPRAEVGLFGSPLNAAVATKQYAVISFLGKYLFDNRPGLNAM